MTLLTTGLLATNSHTQAGLADARTQSAIDDQDRDNLITSHLGLVRRVCAKFRYSGEPMDDLVQVGSVGLLKAVAKYDPDLGSNFAAYAVPVIVGEIKNYFRDHGWAVKIPRKLQRQKLVVGRAVDTLSQDLGRSPTIQEISEATGFGEDEVYDTFGVGALGKPVSLDSEYDSTESDDTYTVLDYLGNVDPELEALPDRVDLAQAVGNLEDREKAIIYMYYYKGLSQTEIAKKLALSQMHVSRLLRYALGKLEQDLAA